MSAFIQTSRKPQVDKHPIVYALAFDILSRVEVGRYWGFECSELSKPTKTPLLVKRIGPDEFAVALRGAGREIRLDLVHTAMQVADTLYALHPVSSPSMKVLGS